MEKGNKNYQYDVFLSFANEDAGFTRALYEKLQEAGLRVWCSLDKLRHGQKLLVWEVKEAILASQFAVIIVSKPYVTKKWTVAELSTFFALETLERLIIIPIWYRITYEEILKIFPLIFADRFTAMDAAKMELDEMASHTLRMVRNMQSGTLNPKFETIDLFKKVWYTPKEFGFFDYRNAFVGELRLEEYGMAFSGAKTEWFQQKRKEIFIQSEMIQSIEHVKMTGDISKNWVKVTYNNGHIAWLQNHSKYPAFGHGLGNLIGGNDHLFGVLERLYKSSD